MQAIKAMFDLTAALIHALNIYSCLRERSTKMETATEFKNSYVLTYETSIISLKKEKKKLSFFIFHHFIQACKFIVH